MDRQQQWIWKKETTSIFKTFLYNKNDTIWVGADYSSILSSQGTAKAEGATSL